MNNDNTILKNTSDYDRRVYKDIPYYEALQTEVIEFARCYKDKYQTWLDTGCGTGSLGYLITKESLTKKLILADPSLSMLKIAKKRNSEKGTEFCNSQTQDLNLNNNSVDIITAIQAHHYGNKNERRVATKNVFRMLVENGLFITSEHYNPGNELSNEIFMRYWMNQQLKMGKSKQEAVDYLKRFNTEYFPISIENHLKLYKEIGFNSVEILWKSYLQVVFVMIK